MMAPSVEGRHSVAVAPIDMGEGVDGRLADPLRASLVEGIERGAGQGQSIESDPDCDEACLLDRGRQIGATYLLESDISKPGPDHRIVLQARSIEDGQIAARVEGVCEICGDAELEARVADLAAAIEARLQDLSRRPASVVVRGAPEGAEVYFDGERVGVTPFEGDFQPGTHQIELRAPGFVTETIQWTADRGEVERIRYELEPLVTGDGPGAWVAPTAWTFVGAGLAAIGGGVALIMIDERPHQATCSAEYQDMDGDCPFRLQTMPAGIGVGAAGVVLAGVGAGLLIWKAKGSKRKAADSSAASLDVGPTRVGLRLRF